MCKRVLNRTDDRPSAAQVAQLILRFEEEFA
jgi:hypothetical protein